MNYKVDGSVFKTGRKIESVEEWMKAFSIRYQGMPKNVARSLAARDFRIAKGE